LFIQNLSRENVPCSPPLGKEWPFLEQAHCAGSRQEPAKLVLRATHRTGSLHLRSLAKSGKIFAKFGQANRATVISIYLYSNEQILMKRVAQVLIQRLQATPKQLLSQQTNWAEFFGFGESDSRSEYLNTRASDVS
jgi:hypothetical protein